LNFPEHELQLMHKLLLPFKYIPPASCGLGQLHNIHIISGYIFHLCHTLVGAEVNSYSAHLIQSLLCSRQMRFISTILFQRLLTQDRLFQRP
jgi:hypothetical protein